MGSGGAGSEQEDTVLFRRGTGQVRSQPGSSARSAARARGSARSLGPHGATSSAGDSWCSLGAREVVSHALVLCDCERMCGNGGRLSEAMKPVRSH